MTYFDHDGVVRVPCPVCGGPTELTPSLALVCREYGSDHYREAEGQTVLRQAAADLEAAL